MSWIIDFLGSREWLLLMVIVIAAAALAFPVRNPDADEKSGKDKKN